ncbi:MAG: hypothetical protein RIC19_01920 [Phaeodactylibacter sp.]|uniref:hypothetical protein n=1 Tax=Phaeodactylibacter sp. TaxID=1940289 RepID=UPI0032EB8771
MRWLIIAGWLLASGAAFAQNLGGQWDGYLSQDGKTDTFVYRIQLQQSGSSLNGEAYSATGNGRHSARFLLTGYWNGQQLILQEVEQTEPASPKWCTKYATLNLEEQGGIPTLSGPWRADGCTPGQMFLKRPVKSVTDTVAQEIEPTIAGKWSGTLSQSDRDYGFYFEIDLGPRGLGGSYIVSEGNGGSAHMDLEYRYDAPNNQLHFQEGAVVKKEDPAWPWCIKSGDLAYRREGSRLVLEGTWAGYIEGYDMESGPCASGALYLEKPVLTEEIVQTRQAIAEPYQMENQRQIKVQRVLEVSSPNIRIKIWDNGTVDGDVATLFLNGERILNKYRVSKRRIGIPVTLSQTDNFLVLHADDLGDIRPNTVAVSVDDGEREQVIIVSSNLEESGAVMIKQFRVD